MRTQVGRACSPGGARRWAAAGVLAAWVLSGCGGGGAEEAAVSQAGPDHAGAQAAGGAGALAAAPGLGLSVDCDGQACAAGPEGRWLGDGVGAWRLHNAGPEEATVEVALSGLTPGQRVLLLFSNGSEAASPTLPASGTSADTAAAAAAPAWPTQPLASQTPETRAAPGSPRAETHAHDHGHAGLAARNHHIDRHTPLRPKAGDEHTRPDVAPSPAPVLGSTRTWFDTFGTRTPYMTSASAVCALTQGRRAVFWVDPNAVAAGHVGPADLALMQQAYCGPSGGFARLVGLMGEPWGAHGWSNLIEDAPLQDIHVAIIDAPPASGWAGYFSSVNKYRTSARPDSNEALVVFLRASQLRVDLRFLTSTLLHETAHLVNNYQRWVRRGVLHEPWLEETSAMMVEDIVTPRVLAGWDGRPYNKITDVRVPGYLASGGAVSYIDWQRLAVPNYDLGGTFGAWLNRRYGLAIARALVTECGTTLVGSSYACVDALIRRQGGPGFAAEFARLGATVFATLGAAGSPEGYRFAARREQDYELAAVDLGALAWRRPSESPALTAGWAATMHAWREEVVAAGQSTWRREQLKLPAGTTLVVVVR